MVFDYDRCSEQKTSFSDGYLVMQEPLPLLQTWMTELGMDADTLYAYRSRLLTGRRNEEYASRGKDILDYYERSHAIKHNGSGNGKVKKNGSAHNGTPLLKADVCVNFAVKNAMEHFRTEINGKNKEGFNQLPFAMNVSVSERLWKLMEKEGKTARLRKRKPKVSPDLIVGVLRLMDDSISVADLKQRIHWKK